MAQTGTTKKFDRAIKALLESSTVTQAAAKAKIGRRTLVRWLHEDPAFQERLSQARREMLRHGTSRLIGLLGQAVDVVAEALSGGKVGKNRYLSAKLVIETALVIQEHDLEDRVSELERRVRERHGRYDTWTNDQLESRLAELRNQNLANYTADDLRRAIREKIAAGNGEDDEDNL